MNAPAAPPILLTIREAAATLKCSRATIFRLISAGVLVRPHRFGRQSCVLAESVYAALEKSLDPPARPKRVRSRRATFAREVEETLAALKRSA